MNKACILLTILALLPSEASAGQEAAAKPYALSDCIEIAMQNNVDALTARNNLVAARSRSAVAMSEYLPSVSLQNVAFAWGSQGVLNKTTTGTALSVSQNIYDGGLRETNARSARYDLTGSTAEMTRTLQKISFEVSEAYFEVLRARHLAEVAQASVTYDEGLRDQVLARAGEGDAARVDVLPVAAQLAGARVTLLSRRSAIRTSLIRLQSVMGVSPDPGFDIQEVGDPQVAQVAKLEASVAEALQSRPDAAQMRADTGAARMSVRSAKLAMLPRPTISAEFQRQVSGGFTVSGTQVVGGIAFDIFDGGANRAAYKVARINQANAELREQQAARDIRLQVEEAHLALTSARERMAASALSLDAADQNYLVQTDRYAQGLGTTLDLLNAQAQAVAAKSDDVQARYDYYTAVAQMEYAVGTQGGLL